MKKRFIYMVCACAVGTGLLLGGCAATGSTSETQQTIQQNAQESVESTQEANEVSEGIAQTTGIDVVNQFTDRDSDASYDAQSAVSIALSGNGAAVTGEGAVVDGSTVTITAEGTYVVSGTLTNGQIVIDCAKTDKVQLVLDGVDISCSGNAAIVVNSADKVFLSLAEGSQNTVTSTGIFPEDDNVDASIFSREDLTINGNGTLTVSCENGHGIVSKDDLAITGGNLVINAASHGLSGKNSIRIKDGTLDITSGKDGMHSENADDASLGYIYIAGGILTIRSEMDGIDAMNALQIDGGTFTLATGGGSENASTTSSGAANDNWGNWGNRQQTAQTETSTEITSAKGLKADGDVVVNGGSFIIDSSDDSLHSNANVMIAGGEFSISSGDDGIHADTQTAISAGVINIAKSYEGIEGQNIVVSGGNIAVVASDDGLNAAGGNDSSGQDRPGADNFTASADCYIEISGGELTVDSSGDGIDSNGTLTITGGTIMVSGPTNDGNGTLDYNGSATITGGTFLGAGSSGMAQGFSGTQPSILYTLSSSQKAGTTVTLLDSSGNMVTSFQTKKQFNCVQISTPDLTENGQYTLKVGEQQYSIELNGTTYSNGGMGNGGMGGKSGNRPGA
ncbi:MAG: carbohydrate-binding domain-containing protein [Christensenella sp.]|nr:carbohydrate-binding domain-containing protein [Christensenella sp.]